MRRLASSPGEPSYTIVPAGVPLRHAVLFLFDSFLIPDPATAGGTFGRLNSGTSIERPDATLVCLDRFDVCSETPGGAIPGIDGGCRA